MSENNEKFKLTEDPNVAGGSLDWNYCPKCGTTLREGYCRRCEKDYLNVQSETDNYSGRANFDMEPAPVQKPTKIRSKTRPKNYTNNYQNW